MRVGVLTGGGDSPGLNPAIRAVTRRCIEQYDDHVLGIKNGWDGLVSGDVEPLSLYSITGILPKGGTILGTSRHNPTVKEENIRRIMQNIRRYELDAVVAIGGEDTLHVAEKLAESGLKYIAVPKTIDNDIGGTDMTFGFDTAVTVATDAIDRLHTTAEAHHRVIVVEVMGRESGWIAVMSGIAGGADCILIPEVPFTVDETCEMLIKRHKHGKNFSIVVIAEGAYPKEMGKPYSKTGKVDEFGHMMYGGIGDAIARQIEEQTGMETRVVVLGLLQRGGSPTPYDRVLATRFGTFAADMVHEQKFGYMAALRGTQVVSHKVSEALKTRRSVDPKLYEVAKVFFG